MKKYIFVLLTVLFISSTLALTSTITSFYNKENPFNVSFLSFNGTQTENIILPLYANFENFELILNPINLTNADKLRESYYFDNGINLADGVNASDIGLNGSYMVVGQNTTAGGWDSSLGTGIKPIGNYTNFRSHTGDLSIQLCGNGTAPTFEQRILYDAEDNPNWNGTIGLWVYDDGLNKFFYVRIQSTAGDNIAAYIKNAADYEYRLNDGAVLSSGITRKLGWNYWLFNFTQNKMTWYVNNTYIIENTAYKTQDADGLDYIKILAETGGDGCAWVDDFSITEQQDRNDIGYPYNLNLSINGTTIYNKIGVSKGKETIQLKEEYNAILDNSCICEGCVRIGDNCKIENNFNPLFPSILELNISNSTYKYGVDNCSDYTYKVFNMSYFDEDTSEVITANATYDLIVDNFDQELAGSFIGRTGGGFCSNVNLTARDLNLSLYGSITLASSGYETRITSNDAITPYVVVTNPYYYLNLYLINTVTSGTTTFTAKDLATSQIISGVSVSMYQKTDGEYFLVSNKLTDIIGKAEFSYIEDKLYKFIFTKDNYGIYEFELHPITSETYDVFLTKIVTLNRTSDRDRLSINWEPQIYYDAQVTSFNFTIYSPYSELNNYSYLITYPGGSSTNLGSDPDGETLNSVFTIAGATIYDRLQLDFTYNSDIAGTRTFTYYYDIISEPGNYTMMNNKGKTYGMGLFERIFIVTIIGFLVVGIAALMGQVVPGLGLALIVYSYFVYIGFIDLWLILVPVLMGIWLLAARSE